MKTPPMIAVDTMDGEAFFTALMEALQKIPPHVHDQAVVARMKRLGLEPGKRHRFHVFAHSCPAGVEGCPGRRVGRRPQARQNLGSAVNGWSVLTGGIGYYGADYTFRASVALVGLGANRPEDAVYPLASTDGDGKPLSGANRYALVFPKGQTPPVDAFWLDYVVRRQRLPGGEPYQPPSHRRPRQLT